MPNICYIPKTFSPRHSAIIDAAVDIVVQFARVGIYDLSLRQLYYQFIAHRAQLFPGNGPGGSPNTEQNYKMLGDVLSSARLAGRFDWLKLVDRGRSSEVPSYWNDVGEIFDSCVRAYTVDLWEGQQYHVEVVVEKQALEGVLSPVCRALDVPFTSNKGYSSQSALWRQGQRLAEYLEDDKDIVILYLGDHDPSGIDMTRDVHDRLALFSGAGEWVSKEDADYWGMDSEGVRILDEYDGRFTVERIGLTMAQVRQFDPPPNPTKVTDSRAGAYIREHGYTCWELDALDPQVMRDLVRDAITGYIDQDKRNERIAYRDKQRAKIQRIADAHRDSFDEDDDDA